MVPNAFEVLASELLCRARFVLRVAELSFVRSITAIVVVIASPSLVDAASVFTSELVVGAWLRCWTIVQSYVLIGAINTIGIAIAKPLLGNALRTAPGFVFLACELSFCVTLSIVALMSIIFIAVIQTIVITI